MTTATQTEEIQANPYNANKTWDNSNPDLPRGGPNADSSMAYSTPRKDVMISSATNNSTEEQVTPVEATQESESSSNTYQKVDYKKRYDDLKKHYDRKLGDWKSKEQGFKAELLENRPTYTAPKTPEELATFREDYPDVYDVVETVAHMRAEEQVSSLQQQVKVLAEREDKLVRKDAEQQLLEAHPDFIAIRDSEDFHIWAKTQPDVIQTWIYDNGNDASLASRAIDLYKQDVGISTGKKTAVKKKSPKKDARGSAADAVKVTHQTSEPTSEEKIWTTSEIAGLSVDQYEKLERELDAAFTEGRVVNQ